MGGIDVVMKSGCPTVSSQAWQIGLFGRAHEVAAATGCPIAVEQAAQIQALPQRCTQQREEAGEAVAPLAQERTEAQQQIHQQRCPNLPAHGVGVVSEEVRQLERLLQFLEKDFDAPTTAVEIGDGLGAPGQVVGQEHQLPPFAVHFDARHHPAQLHRIGPSGRPAGQLNQVVTEDVTTAPRLQFAPHPTAQIVFGAGDPVDLALRQVGQVGEVHIGFVEDDNLARRHGRAQFMRPAVVVLTGGVHNDKAGQEGLEIEPHMTFRGGLAAAMLGPIHTPGHQLNGSRVHDMNQPLEAEGELRSAAGAEARMQLLQMIEHGPKQLFRQLRVAFTVGVGERVLAGRRGPTNRRQRPRMQVQRITDIVETQGVGQLGVEQTQDMTPRTKRPGVGVHPGGSGQLRHQMVGNQIAELPQECETTARWLVGCGFMHGLPCGRSTHRKPTSFFQRHLKTAKPVGRQ